VDGVSLLLNSEAYRAVLDDLPAGVYLVDRERRIVFWNHAAERITGFLAQEVLGHSCFDNLLMHCDEDNRSLCGNGCPLLETMHDGKPRRADVLLRHKQGHRVPVWVHAAPIRDEHDIIVGVAESFEERRSRPDDASQANADMANLQAALEVSDGQQALAVLNFALESFAAGGESFGVLCVGIDNLEEVRHKYGSNAVGALLREAAQTLARDTRPQDRVGFWRGERLVVVVAGADPESLQGCARRLQRLANLTGVPWWGDRLSVTVSMGGTVALPGDTVKSLMGRAEAALDACPHEPEEQVVVH
jgi:PAS domain S-box-containing protein/diguanylate cyclase (GGDEF)-like protein